MAFKHIFLVICLMIVATSAALSEKSTLRSHSMRFHKGGHGVQWGGNELPKRSASLTKRRPDWAGGRGWW